MKLKIDPLHLYSSIGLLFHNRYWLEAQLGVGGAAVVYRALDTCLDRRVALKIFRVDRREAEWRAGLRSEAVSLARLSHAGIVRIYDFNEADDLVYLSLELIPGRDLWTVLAERENILPLHASLRLCRNILEVLDYAHCQGVVHRDLKPENVMVRDVQFNIGLTDFGLAFNGGTHEDTCVQSIAGSACYLAPEVIRGQRADARSDLYALGVMLYELTTGQLPFYDEDPVQVMLQHLNDPPLPPTCLNPDIPAALETIILRLLAKHPEERFQSAAKTLAALELVSLMSSCSEIPSVQSICICL